MFDIPILTYLPSFSCCYDSARSSSNCLSRPRFKRLSKRQRRVFAHHRSPKSGCSEKNRIPRFIENERIKQRMNDYSIFIKGTPRATKRIAKFFIFHWPSSRLLNLCAFPLGRMQTFINNDTKFHSSGYLSVTMDAMRYHIFLFWP